MTPTLAVSFITTVKRLVRCSRETEGAVGPSFDPMIREYTHDEHRDRLHLITKLVLTQEIPHFSAVVYATSVKCVVRSSRDTQPTPEPGFDRMVVKYTHTTNTAGYGMFLTLGTCHSRPGADARYSHYIILCDVIQRVLRFLPSPIAVTYKCISPIDCTYTSTWRYHNCSCGTRDTSDSAILHENWDYPNRRSSWYSLTLNRIHTAIRGTYLYFRTIVVYSYITVRVNYEAPMAWSFDTLHHLTITYDSKTRLHGQALYNTLDICLNMASHYGDLVRLFACILYILCVPACAYVCVCVCGSVDGCINAHALTLPLTTN